MHIYIPNPPANTIFKHKKTTYTNKKTMRQTPFSTSTLHLSHLITTSLIHYLPSLHYFLSLIPPHFPPSLSRPLSLHYFPLFPPKTTTFLFNTLLRQKTLHPLPLFSSLLLLSIPDDFTFPSLLKSLHSFTQGTQIHTHVLVRGFQANKYIVNSLLSMYSRFGRMPDAQKLFKSSRECLDVVSWNVILNGYVRLGEINVARKVFDQMPVRDEASWGVMVSGYVGRGELDVARVLVDRMPAGRNLLSWNSLVSGFARSGMVGLARRYFDEMPERNLVSWNAMVSGYAMNGEMDSAKKLFDSMEERDVVSWSCMIGGYTQSGRHLEALQLFKVMLKDGRVRPNEITMVSVLSACAHLSALDQGKWIHAYIDKKRMVLDDNRNLGAGLIDMYFKCGAMESALDIFHSLNRKNVSSWNALITGLAVNGLARDALSFFKEMKMLGTMPDDITFVGVLTACTHGGLIEEGREYFKIMCKDYGVKQEMKHYGCMIDMLGRAGLLGEAEGVVKRMLMKPDAAILGALLGACRIHRNVEIAARIQNEFLELKSEQGGCHFLLSNIYANADKWADASKMRRILKERGIKKKAGSSSVESNGL